MSYNYIVPWSVQHISPFPSSFRFVVVSFYLGDFFLFPVSMFRLFFNVSSSLQLSFRKSFDDW